MYSSPARALPALPRLPGRRRCAPPPLGRCLIDEYLPLACGPVRRCRGTHCIRDLAVACAVPDAPPPRPMALCAPASRTMLYRGCRPVSYDGAAPPAPGCCSCLPPLRFRRPRLPVGPAPSPPAGCRASPAPFLPTPQALVPPPFAFLSVLPRSRKRVLPAVLSFLVFTLPALPRSRSRTAVVFAPPCVLSRSRCWSPPRILILPTSTRYLF
jgi:hypothetical protein